MILRFKSGWCLQKGGLSRPLLFGFSARQPRGRAAICGQPSPNRCARQCRCGEMADAWDLKSQGGNTVRVRPPPPAPNRGQGRISRPFFMPPGFGHLHLSECHSTGTVQERARASPVPGIRKTPALLRSEALFLVGAVEGIRTLKVSHRNLNPARLPISPRLRRLIISQSDLK